MEFSLNDLFKRAEKIGASLYFFYQRDLKLYTVDVKIGEGPRNCQYFNDGKDAVENAALRLGLSVPVKSKPVDDLI